LVICTHAGTDNDNSKSDDLLPQEVADAVNGNCDAIKHIQLPVTTKVLLGYSYPADYFA